MDNYNAYSHLIEERKYVTLNEQTTFWGALMSFDSSELKIKTKIGLSVLIHLGQFIDSIVLNERIGIIKPSVIKELGDIYENSFLYKELGTGVGKIITTYEIDQNAFDINNSFLKEAAESLINDIPNIGIDRIKSLLNSRKQTYLKLDKIVDKNKSDLKKLQKQQFDIAVESLNDIDRNRFFKSLFNLELSKEEEIKLFHSYYRIKLYQFILEKKVKGINKESEEYIYNPNFFRQSFIDPIFHKTYDPKNLDHFVLDSLTQFYIKLRKKDNIDYKLDAIKESDLMGKLSPIFISVLLNSERPEDIIIQARELRSKAENYRKRIKTILNKKYQKSDYDADSKLQEEISKIIKEYDTLIGYDIYKLNFLRRIKQLSLPILGPGSSVTWDSESKYLRSIRSKNNIDVLLFMQNILSYAYSVKIIVGRIQRIFNCNVYNDLLLDNY